MKLILFYISLLFIAVAGRPADSVAPCAGIGPKSLIINEFICKGTDPGAAIYLGGATAKWFELYNPTDKDIELTAGQWYITDTLGVPQKFSVPANGAGPQWKVPAGKYLVVMCPKKGTTTGTSGRLSTTFSLSSTAGDIGIFYRESAGSPLIAVDQVHYDFGAPGAIPGKTYGHKPDGQGEAVQLLGKATPEAPNE